MATVTLQDILGGPNLCGVIQGTATGIPNVFPQEFYQVDKTVDRDTGEYTRVSGTRTVARIAAYGSPSQQRQLRGVEAVPVKLIHSVESILLPTTDYLNLLQYDDTAKQQRGIQEVTRQVREFRRNFDNLRVAALTQMLFQGAIYWDGAGNLLPSSTGAKTVANFGVPSGNLGQLDPLSTGTSVLDTSWDNPAADVDTQLLSLRQIATRLSGYPLKYAFYGKNVPGYLTSNTKLANYFIRNPGENSQYLSSAEIPSPLLGMTWLPAYDAFFEDATGTLQNLVGDDQVVFTPEPSTDWIGWLEGTYPVPTNLGTVSSDAAESLKSSVTTASGMFAYGIVNSDPVTVKMVAGDTFLPVLKVPKAIFIATVKF
jgi:Phage major capsid protein E